MNTSQDNAWCLPEAVAVKSQQPVVICEDAEIGE